MHDAQNGYGAGRVLGWFRSGQLLDHGRLPVVTLFAAIGFVLAWRCRRRDANARALLVALAACLLLSLGRTTFGSVVDVIPGSGDIFFRRFMMGIQLAALLLAGDGAAWSARAAWSALDRMTAGRRLGWPTMRAKGELARGAVALTATVVVLAPAWLQLGSYDRRTAQAIRAQRHADATWGAQLDRLIAAIKRKGGGRVYAGMPSNWGAEFTVGAVPVFKYLESRDVDEVGYTLRTASLMTDPEYYFDERDPGDYRLFAIHYLILPAGSRPPVPARPDLRAGPYALWTLDPGGYVHTGTIIGTLAANRTNIGARSIPALRSHLTQQDRYLRVAFAPVAGTVRPHPLPPAGGATPGEVSAETDDLSHGHVAATVTMRHAGVVVLSASFDPGWAATVDGRPQPTEMVAPALVATANPAGTHRVAFSYHGFHGYPLLFAGVALPFALVAWPRRRGSQRATNTK